MKINLKANIQGQIYFPKLLRDQWGNKYVLIPNAQGGLIIPKGVQAKDALKSLEVIKKDLEHQVEMESREVTKT